MSAIYSLRTGRSTSPAQLLFRAAGGLVVVLPRQAEPPKALPANAVNTQNILLTVGEIANILSVTTSDIYYWSGRGEIPVIRVGRLLRFDKEEVLTHFKNKQKSDNKTIKAKSSSKQDVDSRLSSLKSKGL